MSGDMCSNAPATCGNLAHPGHDLCAGCLEDRHAEREITAREAHRLTDEHEQQIQLSEEAA